MLHVSPEDPTSPAATALLAALTRELEERYPEEAGTGYCAPDNTKVARSVFLVAWFGGDAVGCGALRPFAADHATAEIKRMYVDPHLRGKGIGRDVLRELERRARTFGYVRVCLETGIRQPEAIGLYEREGFARIPPFAPYVGNAFSVCFAKALSARASEPRVEPAA